jgi:hypothetical protein
MKKVIVFFALFLMAASFFITKAVEKSYAGQLFVAEEAEESDKMDDNSDLWKSEADEGSNPEDEAIPSADDNAPSEGEGSNSEYDW